MVLCVCLALRGTSNMPSRETSSRQWPVAGWSGARSALRALSFWTRSRLDGRFAASGWTLHNKITKKVTSIVECMIRSRRYFLIVLMPFQNKVKGFLKLVTAWGSRTVRQIASWPDAIKHCQWGPRAYIIVYTILPPSPVVLWIELDGKPKWLPLNFGYHDVMRTTLL